MTIQSVDDVYEDPWLRAVDLNGEQTMEITAWDTHQFKDDEEIKIVLFFRETKKKYAMKPARAAKAAAIIGSKVFADWVGCRIKLIPSRFGETDYIEVGPPAQVRRQQQQAAQRVQNVTQALARRQPIPAEIPYDDPEDPGAEDD